MEQRFGPSCVQARSQKTLSGAALWTLIARGDFLPITAMVQACSFLLLMPLYSFRLTTDSPSYLGIAQGYAEGRWHDAINPYWPPLVSWLAAPLIRIGAEPLDALHALALATGLAGLTACRGLLTDLGIPAGIRGLMLLGLVPVFLAFSLTNPNPDLLVAVLLLFYVRLLFSPRCAENPRFGLACGVLGAAAYLAKTYAFPFFLVHFPLVVLCRHAAERDLLRRRTLRRSLGLGLAAFLLVSSAWMGALYGKYGRLTVGDAGAYNFMLVHNDSGHSFLEGFAEPPNARSLSAWDDPLRLAQQRASRSAGPPGIGETAERIGRNAVATLEAYQAGSFFSMAILAGTAVGLIGLSFRAMLGNAHAHILLTVLLLPAGYWMLLVDRRYLYLGVLLIYALGGSLVMRVPSWSGEQKRAAVILLCLSFAFVPLRDLRANAGFNDDVRRMASVLADAGVRGRIAADGAYDRSLYAAYFLAGGREGVTFLGIPRRGTDASQVSADLLRHRCDYYLCWGGESCPAARDLRAAEVARLEGLRVYRVR